jgi:O-antigen/teichoic acid export membrane protein
MQKKFLTNLGILLFLNLLVKPFWVLGIDRSVQNAVGAEDFGFYFAVLNFSFLFNILLDLGVTNFNNRNIAQHAHLLNKHFSSILILKILLGIVYVLFTFVIGWIIGYSSKQFTLLGWVVLNQFLLSFILYLRSNISGLLLFKTDSFLSVLDRLLMIIFCAVLLWGNVTEQSFRIEWFVYAQTAAYALTFLTALFIVIQKSAFRRLHWNVPLLLLILKKSAPFALLVLLSVQFYRIDTVIIERVLPGETGDQQAGVYAQAYRLLDAVNMIAFLFSILLLPLFSRMIKLKQEVVDLVRLSFSMLFTISSVVAIGSFFYSREIMELLYPIHTQETLPEYTLRINQSGTIYGILMFGLIAMAINYVFGTLLTANGNLKALNIFAGVAVVLSLVINLVLVPRIMATGSAYASLSANGFLCIAQVIFAIHIFKFKTNWRYLTALILFVAAIGLAGYFSKQISSNWILNLGIWGGASILLSFVLRLLNIREFFNILKTG